MGYMKMIANGHRGFLGGGLRYSEIVVMSDASWGCENLKIIKK